MALPVPDHDILLKSMSGDKMHSREKRARQLKGLLICKFIGYGEKSVILVTKKLT